MMKKILMALLAAGCVMAGTITAGAANRLNLQGIGTMDVPQKITCEKGPQNALPFMAEGGTKRFFIRNGMTKSDYYTMTWKKGPDFSYGWAMSQETGIPFLLEIGEIRHKDDKPLDQMDVIANWLNRKLMADGASFEGTAPLKKIDDKKHPRWEGFVTITTKEQDITYHEAYTLILQCDGYFTTLGIINSDGDRSDITDSLRKMISRRKFPQKVNLLDLSKRGTSLTEFE